MLNKSKYIYTFAVVQESHGFIPNFFRAQTLRPDLLEAELDAVGLILLPEDFLTRVQKESILLTVSAANRTNTTGTNNRLQRSF